MADPAADRVAGILAEACFEYHRLEAADASVGVALDLTPFVEKILALTRPAPPAGDTARQSQGET
jgi:hypothetical protein